MIFFIVFPLIALGITLAIAAGVRQAKASREAWMAAAHALGFAIDAGTTFKPPEMHGSSGGFEVEVDTYTQRSGNNSTTYTRYRVYYPSLGMGMKLTRQHALHRISKFFGQQDVEVGDTTFDDAFIIKADNPGQVVAFLTPSRRMALLRLFANFKDAVVDDDSITVRTLGREKEGDKLVSTSRRIVGAARRLHDMDEIDDSVDRLLEQRRVGDLSASSREVQSIIHPHPDDVDGRILEVETLATSGRRDEAAAAVEELRQVLPGDQEVEGWREYLEAPAPPPPAPRPVDGVEDDRFFDTLFASTQMSYETTRLFEERFKGRPVTWTGRVRESRTFSDDYDFGHGPGVKAVITVATIEHDLYGQTQVDAIVQLPAGAASLRRGDEVTFSGLLMRVDPLMRNVYVTGARLT